MNTLVKFPYVGTLVPVVVARRVAFATLLAAIFMLLASLPHTAYAAATDQGATFTGVLEGMKGIMSNIVDNAFGKTFAERLKSNAVSLASGTTTVANAIAGALAAVTLLWAVMVAMVEKKSVIGATFEVLLFGIVAAALINNYQTVVDQVWGTANDILSAVGLDIPTTFGNFLTSFFTPIGNLVARMVDAFGAGFWTLDFAGAVIDSIFSVLLLLVILILLIYSLVHIVGVFVMGPVFFAVGVVFGPIMMATIVSSYTRQWFNQWLNFLVGSAFLSVVAVTVLRLLTLTIENAVTSLATQGSSTLALLGVAILMAMASKLYQAVPSITDAIFPGRTGAGKAIGVLPLGASKAGGGASAAGLAAKASAAGAAYGPVGMVASLTKATMAKTANPVSTAQAGAAAGAGAMKSAGKAIAGSDAGRLAAGVARGMRGATGNFRSDGPSSKSTGSGPGTASPPPSGGAASTLGANLSKS